jgi:hypothetical protein
MEYLFADSTKPYTSQNSWKTRRWATGQMKRRCSKGKRVETKYEDGERKLKRKRRMEKKRKGKTRKTKGTKN